MILVTLGLCGKRPFFFDTWVLCSYKARNWNIGISNISIKHRFQGFSNPFGVAKLFSLTPTLRKYSMISLLQYMCEPKNLSDISAMFQMDRLNWSSAKRDIFVSIMGFSFLFGSAVTKRSIGALGPRRHTSVMHYLSILQYCLRAFPYEVTTWMGVGVMMISETKMNGVAALATDEAVKNGGLGKGEYSGLSANLRALMVFLSPFFKLFFCVKIIYI